MKFQELITLPEAPTGKAGWPWSAASGLTKFHDKELWPRITIVTPSYNQGQFLEQTIRSVLLQNYPNLQYIIIDGGSTDNSIEVIKKYEKHLDYWVSEPDNGQSHAINKGLKKASGEIIAWLNSDDFYFPGVFNFIAEELKIERQTFALVGHCQIIYPDTGKTRLSRGHYENLEKLLEYWKGYTMPQSSIFWRKEVVDKIGLLDEQHYYIMDFDYWVRIAQHFEFKNADRILSCATYHANAKTGDDYAAYHKKLRENIQGYLNTIPDIDNSKLQESLDEYDRFKIKVLNTIGKIDKVIPSKVHFILIDEDQMETNDFVAGRKRCHFPEHQGNYYGLPADDAFAIKHLEMLHGSGISHLVIISQCFWWLQYYTGFKKHLDNYWNCLYSDEDIIVFNHSSVLTA